MRLVYFVCIHKVPCGLGSLRLLRHRLLSAFIVIGISLCFVGLDAWLPLNGSGYWMAPLGIYLMFGSAMECTTLLRNSPYGPIDRPASNRLWWDYLGGAGAGLLATVGFTLSELTVCLGNLVGRWRPPSLHLSDVLRGNCRNYQTGNRSFERAILSGWVSVYFGLCFAFWIATRLVGTSGWGLYLMVGIIVITKFSDSGAYFTGRFFGRTKLCPSR